MINFFMTSKQERQNQLSKTKTQNGFCISLIDLFSFFWTQSATVYIQLQQKVMEHFDKRIKKFRVIVQKLPSKKMSLKL